ncbi:transcriptional regulator [Streptomyces spiroverticillatus]|uniref:Transcriptional regulator n=1 Tax=Streptomyces finlayi TaxID=67296 RepID=A0A918X333_9ACTN|nr:helix-turn-helix transcriptional regulator [Streptomyces finlayi]GGZ95216.1 transcriptional regulator [Streptomyces spiroverticillatus]GHD07497.1 transcriptional regulator [Streptomyces finlayi]
MEEDQVSQDNRVSTVLGRRLGGELLNLRLAAELTQGQAAKAISASTAKVAKMERGWVPMRDPDIRVLCELYGLDSPERLGGLLELARLDRERRKAKGWWADAPMSPKMREYVGLEAAATSIRVWQLALIPGLFQTADYVSALRRDAVRESKPEEDAAVVASRLERQRRLHEDPPLRFWAVIHEAALRHVVGGRVVMRAQLENLARLSSKPNITIQVMPFSAGAHPLMSNAFNILSFAEAGAMDVVYQETVFARLWVEGGDGAADFVELFDRVAARALSETKSRDLINAIHEEL